MVGLLTGVRWRHWLLRLAFEVRVGRTTEPYWVNESGYFGRSDRFDAVYIGLEFGHIVYRRDRHNIDLFVGLGFDGVKPFKEEDLMLGTVNANVGLGYRLFIGKNRNWILGVDGKHEWIGDRNENGDSLSGQAWSARVGLGFLFDEGRDSRLKGLGH
jgi:hypothetical protein